MYARKIWTPECISWKKFYWDCYNSLDKIALDCTQEEFEEHSVYHIDTLSLLEDQDLPVGLADLPDLCTPQQWEAICDKCEELYNQAYDDVYEECKEARGWHDYE